MIQKPYKTIQLITGLGIGGAERVVCELASALTNQGFSIQIVALINLMGMLDQYPDLKKQTLCLNINKNPFSFIKAVYKLSKLIKKEEIQIVHAHMFHSLLISIFMKILNPELKIIFTSHSFQGYSFFRTLLIKLTKALRNADIIFSKNQHPKMNVDNTHIIHNGIKVTKDISYAIKIEKKYTFIFIGRLETVKNPIALIHALSKTKVKSNLLIIGDGYLLKDVKELIKKLNLETRIELYGLSTDVAAHLLRAQCLVLCSLYEGLPMVVLEAGALGLPVISTPVGSVPELLSENCGYLTDLHQLAEKMDFVATNTPDANKKGINLHAKICAHYSLEHMVSEHALLYKNTFSGTKS